MLTTLQKMDEHRNNFNKEKETIRKYQTEVTELQYTRGVHQQTR